MHALIIQNDSSTRTALSFILSTEVGAITKESTNAEEAMEVLKASDTKIDLIICSDMESNRKLFDFLITTGAETKCLLIRDPKSPPILKFPDLVLGHVNPSNISEEIKKRFAEEIKTANLVVKEGEDGNYLRILAIAALQSFPLKYDLYVRLSSIKYVRVFNKDDSFTEVEVKEYLARKKIEYLYFHKSEAGDFANQLKANLIEKMKTASVESPVEATRSAAEAHEAIMELGSRIGFTPEVQAAARQGMLTTLKTVGTGKPQLAKILKGIIADKNRYAGSHAILTSQVACSLAHGLSWSSETTFQKLTFASFFHDMILTNNSLAQVKTMAEIETRKGEFTEEEVKRYKMHPAIVAQLISNFSEVPPDVNIIISQHHEKPDGSGFPRGLDGQHISPLSSLFIIAHDFVGHIFEHGMENIDPFLADYKSRYTGGHFRKILAKVDLQQLGLK